MVRLSEESIKQIEIFVSKKYLPTEVYGDLLKSKSKNDIIDCLKIQIQINEITLTKVWTHIIHSIWMSVEQIFNSGEIMILKEILNNNGVIMRTQINENVLNQYMTTKSIQSLEEKGIITILIFDTNEKIIMLNPKFRCKIFDGNTTNN